MNAPRTLLATCLLALSTACVSTSGGVENDVGPWVTPSPSLRQQIEDQARRLPWTQGMERFELVRWFAAVGEPAYYKLLELVTDPRPDVAGAALAALGATGDSRLVEPLHEIPWPEAKDVDLALERARTLLRLGDWSMVPHLIGGLRDQRPFTRALCARALYEATHERFGYDPQAEEAAREQSVQRWEQWWQRRESEGLVSRRER